MDALITYGLYAVSFALDSCWLSRNRYSCFCPVSPMIFAGGWLIAYLEDYQFFGWGTLIALGVPDGYLAYHRLGEPDHGSAESGGDKIGFGPVPLSAQSSVSPLVWSVFSFSPSSGPLWAK